MIDATMIFFMLHFVIRSFFFFRIDFMLHTVLEIQSFSVIWLIRSVLYRIALSERIKTNTNQKQKHRG